jgi:hypothetical protein
VKRLIPPVRIHSWGGLGSQLFATALAEDLKAIYPKRSLKIILHTGGVTRRLPEVVELFPEFEYEYEEDFQQKSKGAPKTSSKSKFGVRKLVKKASASIGFLAHCDDDSSTKSLSPWVLSIRGHYSYRSINSKFLGQLAARCQSFEPSSIANLDDACVLHYRLGDLLIISEKNPIGSITVAAEYHKIQKQINYLRLIIFSDSPLEARTRFSSLITDETSVLESKTSLVIANAVRAKYFIGTSSKISFWIAGIRAVVYQNRSSLPFENFDQYTNIAGNKSELISTYFTKS